MRGMHGPFLVTRLLALVLLGLIPACASRAEPEATDQEAARQKLELEEIRDMVNLHTKERNHPPARLDDLRPYEPGYVQGFDALQKGRFLIRWTSAGGKDG